MKKENVFRKVIENLPFHNFESNPELTGIYENELTLGEKEPFEVYIFRDIESGERVFITKSYSIQKTVEKVRENNDLKDIIFQFIFQGKDIVNGKPFNKFACGYCTTDEYMNAEVQENPVIAPEPKSPKKK